MTAALLTLGIEGWLADESVYRITKNRANAAENLTWAVMRVFRGSNLGGGGASTVLNDLDAKTATRRLRRAAELFENLADRLED
jgi:hypothetical protein